LRDRRSDVDLIASPFNYCTSQLSFKIFLICCGIFFLASGFYAANELLDSENSLYPSIQRKSVKIEWPEHASQTEALLVLNTKCEDEWHVHPEQFTNPS
jgi:hypothetical protein